MAYDIFHYLFVYMSISLGCQWLCTTSKASTI